jgi:hypothetical protein
MAACLQHRIYLFDDEYKYRRRVLSTSQVRVLPLPQIDDDDD